MGTRSDVIIIGGGMAGISAAAKLAPHVSVTVLEREPTLGYHSTGRSAAIFIRNYGNATLRALNAAAEPEFLEPVGISDRSLLSPRGEMLFGMESDRAKMIEYTQGSEGIDWLSRDEALDLVPILRPEKVDLAIIERAAQEIDVDRMLQGYARLARKHGAQIVTGAHVTSMAFAAGCWRLETSDGMFEAPIVINAAGAWADTIAGLAGAARLGLQPMRRSAVLIPAPGGLDISRWPMFADMSEGFYAKPDAGRLMISPADEDPVEPQDAWADDMVLAEGLDRYEQAVTVSVTRVERNWAGLRTFAPDRTPVVGFDPRAKGFFWLAGQGGYGIQTAPAMASLTAALILSQTPELASSVLAALVPDRLITN
jgi:D-arginine dehydrogenase